MLENFIYAKEKSLFEEALNNGEVLDEAIVFIEDTKEIWNHGTYFDCSSVDLSNYNTKEEIAAELVNYALEAIPDNGVYIYDIDGNFILPNDWNTANNGKAVGVAILTDDYRFVVAKSDIGTNSWGGYGTDISTLTNYTDAASAATDFDGVNNTAKIIAAIGNSNTNDGYRTGTAAGDCAAYVFPNGKTGYLGAAGEWQVVQQNKDALNSALTLIGGTTMKESTYWTSTEYSSSHAWFQWVDSISPLLGSGKGDGTKYVRAFLTPQIKPLKERVSELESSVSDLKLNYFKWSKLELLKNRGSLSLILSVAASPDAIPYTLSINFEYPVESDITINYTSTDPFGLYRGDGTLVCKKGETLASIIEYGTEDVSDFDFVFNSFSPTEDDVYKYEITFG